jgi:hypothetical protein
MTEDGGAAALWIPPGAPELSDDDEARVEPLLRKLIGSHADEVHDASPSGRLPLQAFLSHPVRESVAKEARGRWPLRRAKQASA